MAISFIPNTTFTIMETNPLFSSIVTFYMLILLYFPQVFLKIFVSPLLISTLIILLSLLRLGASQQQQQQQLSIYFAEDANASQPNKTQNDGSEPKLKIEPESESESWKVKTDTGQGGIGIKQCNIAKAHSTPELGPRPEPEICYSSKLVGIDTAANHEVNDRNESFRNWPEPEPALGPNVFLEWDVGAPLEVIYEAYEGEEEGEEAQNDAFLWNNESCKAGIIERYPSLSRYYPESDSDSDSSSSTSLDDDEEREGLIEIALDYGLKFNKEIIDYMIMKANNNDKVKNYEEFHFDDEENLIEIDISPTTKYCDFPW